MFEFYFIVIRKYITYCCICNYIYCIYMCFVIGVVYLFNKQMRWIRENDKQCLKLNVQIPNIYHFIILRYV